MSTDCWTCVHGEVIAGNCKDIVEFIDTAIISCKEGHRVGEPGCPWRKEKKPGGG